VAVAHQRERKGYRGRPALDLNLPFYEPTVFVPAVIVQAEVMTCISVRSAFDVLLTPVTTDLDHFSVSYAWNFPALISLNVL
jgi:hypothetical protein